MSGDLTYFWIPSPDPERAAVHEYGGAASEVSFFAEGVSVDCVYDGVEFSLWQPAAGY